MGLGGRKASRHETSASAKVAGVVSQDYWEFKPGASVMTVDGILGTVTAVQDGPMPGNEAYEVTLDKGMGGGLYTASQLSPAGTTTASVEHTAADDYPELGAILNERPDPAINTVLGSKTAGKPWYHGDHHVSSDCAPGGSGECDGTDYDTNQDCDCHCHEAMDLPNSIDGVKDWHDDYHGVGKYAPENTAEDGSFPPYRASRTAADGRIPVTFGKPVPAFPEPTDDTAVCDHCNERKHVDDFATLGGDRDGDSGPEAYPATCQDCADKQYQDAERRYAPRHASKTAGGKCSFCNMEGNAAGADGEPLAMTQWGKMHPSCRDEWKADSGAAYGYDMDAWRKDSGIDLDDDQPLDSKHAVNDAEMSQYSSEVANQRDPDEMPADTQCNSCGGDFNYDAHGSCPHCGEKDISRFTDHEPPDPNDDYYDDPDPAMTSGDPYGRHEDAMWRRHANSPEPPPFAREAAYHYPPSEFSTSCQHCGQPIRHHGPDDTWRDAENNTGDYRDRHGHEPASAYNDAGSMIEDVFKDTPHHVYDELAENTTGPTKYSSKTAAVPNAQRDKNDMTGHCADGDHESCEDYADTTCLCQCHDRQGVPNKYKTGWEDDQYYPEQFPRTSSLDPYSLIREAAADGEFRFEFTASWSDVRNKAKRIRSEGGVRITSAYKAGVVGEVKGDHHIYETGLQYVPGARKVATWQCGCKWAAYAWGRSPRYKRFEGRMCSHALALQFEAQSRGMFGRDIKEDEHRLPGQKQRTPVVVEYDKDKAKNLTRRTVPPGNMRSVWSKVIEPAPIITTVAQMATSGDDADEIGILLEASSIRSTALVHFAKQAAVNDAWGEPSPPQQTWPQLPGATKQKDPMENPASAGFAAGPDPIGWHTISPMTMGDRVASHVGEDVCSNCAQPIRRSNDPNVPWVHHRSGNSYCDVDIYPEDAVMFAGTPGREEAKPTLHEASQSDTDEAMWDSHLADGATATLNDEPEPALPSTDGSMVSNTEGLLGDQSDQMHATYDDALSPESESIQTIGSAVQDDPSIAAIVAEFQRTAGAQVIMKDSGHGNAGPSDMDIAAAARAHLEGKTAMRAFSPEEQRTLINEQGRAGNVDRLDIADTHYATLDAIRGEDDDEDWMG